MVSNVELLEKLYDLLEESDPKTTTVKMLREKLESIFKVDLSRKKQFLRAAVEEYLLQMHEGKDDDQRIESLDVIQELEEDAEEAVEFEGEAMEDAFQETDKSTVTTQNTGLKRRSRARQQRADTGEPTTAHQVLQKEDSLGQKGPESLWLAPGESKRWAELFFLLWSPVWIIGCLGIIVPFQLFERFEEAEYMMLGIIVGLPYCMVPLVIIGKADRHRPWYDRHWAKANVWIAIYSFVGNYFWTHYFYTLLGASYTFPSWRLNNVPIPLYLMTHAYFCFYHVLSNLSLRRLRHFIAPVPSRTLRWLLQAAWIVVLAYFTAFMETLTIANFPYYTFVDKAAMYRVGSLFYAIYFFISFPLFIRMEEQVHDKWTLDRAAIDSLGAAMFVTILLDIWRISAGPVVQIPGLPTHKDCLSYGLPWLK